MSEETMREMENVLNLQKKLHNSEGPPSYDLRMDRLKRLKEMLLKYSEEILESINDDYGTRDKNSTFLSEILSSLGSVDYSIKNLKKWMKPEKRVANATQPFLTRLIMSFLGAKTEIQYQPLGTIGMIKPWNFPINLIISPVAQAFAAGNRIMLKPSEITPKTSLLTKKMFNEFFDKTEIEVFLGGPDVAEAFGKLKFDHLLFTGSTSNGQKVMESASKSLVPITLELGGKSPVIMDESCDLATSATRIMRGKTVNAGQICIAPDYILINKSIKDKFIKLLHKEIEKLYSNKSLKSDSYCRIVSKNHFERISNLLEDATKKGAKILIGGKLDKKDNFIEPTVIDNVNKISKIHDEEIFGPILPVYDYNDIDEAINFINRKEKPLALYIFSNSNKNINKVLNRTSSGGICINHSTLHYSNYNLPFGGVNNSGFGRCHGIYGFREFSNSKSVFRQYFPFSPTDLLVPPYNRYKKIIIKYLLKYF